MTQKQTWKNKYMNYKDYIIKKGDKELGLLWSDIEEHLLTPAQYEKFLKYMNGQNLLIFGGMEDAGQVSLIYTEDFIRFINSQPNLD